jgi:glutathione S-transferase
VAVFDPFIAGRELSIADCAAFAHLPIVSLVTKRAFGRDYLEDIPALKPYLKMLGERPAFARVNEDRKATAASK